MKGLRLLSLGLLSENYVVITYSMLVWYFLFIGLLFGQVWSSSQTQISNVLHSGCEKIHLSGDADTALFDHAATVVKVIKRHVQRWRRKAGMKTVKQ